MRFYKYRSDSQYRPSFGGLSFLPPVIRFMLFANVGIFVLGLFFDRLKISGMPLGDWMMYLFALWPVGSELFKPWQLFSYMFLHADFMHVLFNMLALWMFGVELEQIWGSRRFGVYYLLCGLGGALGQLFVAPLFSNPGPTIGASGAIFGILLAFGLMFPDRLVYFYFFLPVKAKYFVLIYVGLEIFALGGTSNVAHLAHLGGAAAGLLFLLVEDKLPIDQAFDWVKGLFGRSPAVKYQPGGRGADPLRGPRVDAKFEDVSYDENAVTQEMIDRILDKISKTGYQNLTEQEKKILFDASKKLH